MEEVGYADLFSFKYSVRPGTGAAGLPDDVPPDVKQERLDRLQQLQRRMTLERNRSFVGSIQEVLVEGVSKRGDQLYGRTSGNRVVELPRRCRAHRQHRGCDRSSAPSRILCWGNCRSPERGGRVEGDEVHLHTTPHDSKRHACITK